MELYLLVLLILGLVIAPLYVNYRLSGYSRISKHSFFIVHLSIFLDERSWFLRRIFRRYLGLYHEYRIYARLEKIPGYKKILANLYILQGVTLTDTEIDILLIHESGIYSIEAKDMAGSIKGREDDTRWIQEFGRRIHYDFPNPMRQNYGHIKSLEKILPHTITSLIIFSWRSRLYISHPGIIKNSEIKKYFSSRQSGKLTDMEIEAIYKKLEPYSHSTRQQEDIHIREIRNRYNGD